MIVVTCPVWVIKPVPFVPAAQFLLRLVSQIGSFIHPLMPSLTQNMHLFFSYHCLEIPYALKFQLLENLLRHVLVLPCISSHSLELDAV